LPEVFEVEIGGRSLIFSTGELAKLAGGAVEVRYGDSVVLATACAASQAQSFEERDFFPLTVEYREKTYAAGRIPGGFFKREGRPSEKEILTSRRIDRPCRPLFPEDFRNEVQIIVYALSSDLENDTDILAINGASAALCISEIPFNGPIAALRVGRVDGQLVVNPTFKQLETADLDMVIVGNEQAIVMLEGQALSVAEETVVQAIELARPQLTRIINLQKEIMAKVGKPKMEYTPLALNQELLLKMRHDYFEKIYSLIQIKDKEENYRAHREFIDQAVAALVDPTKLEEEGAITEGDVTRVVTLLEQEALVKLVLEEGKRPDGRALDEIRPLESKVGVLPRTHGSALFTRGQTQALVVATLGTTDDEQLVENLERDYRKKFMLHYNFPPFSVGEVRMIRGVGRREIGHGALAEHALQAVVPEKEFFPYTIRLVSDILESNGSSSMASVCGGSLALMDAGVPVKDAVAGVAMGLVSDASNRYRILTDIQGLEDHIGQMDLKVAGTAQGITAFQMDLKVTGISSQVIEEGFAQARKARLFILDSMNKVIDKPRVELSPYAPRITIIQIPVDKIGDVIGTGGKIIRKIIEETGCKIEIEDDGTVLIASTDSEQAAKAQRTIEELTAVPEVGKVYTGRVVRLMNFGAFVEIMPGTEGLVHISQLDTKRVNKVEDVVKVGDTVTVKVTEIDDQGRVNLSRKAVLLEQGGVDAGSSGDRRSGSSRQKGGGRRGGERDRRPPRRD
jgi:polyribonucleotide nucleotidyltransferase